jgi:hypothetical protein
MQTKVVDAPVHFKMMERHQLLMVHNGMYMRECGDTHT